MLNAVQTFVDINTTILNKLKFEYNKLEVICKNCGITYYISKLNKRVMAAEKFCSTECKKTFKNNKIQQSTIEKKCEYISCNNLI